MKKTISFLAVLVILFSSCKKDTVFLGDPNANPSSGSVAVVGLSGTSWRSSASTSRIEFDANTIVDFDLFTSVPACGKDNILTFQKNGRLLGDEGPTKCNIPDPQTQDAGAWSLSADKKLLILSQLSSASYGVGTLNAEVIKLDDKTLIIKYITYINGPKATTTSSYIRVN